MTMPLTYKAANLFLDHLVGTDLIEGRGTSVHIGLSSTAPNRDGSGYTEPAAATGYARVGIGKNTNLQCMEKAKSGAATNESTIFFPEAMASWGKLTYYLLFDAATGGNLLAYGPLDDPISPEKGKVPIIRPGNLTMTMR